MASPVPVLPLSTQCLLNTFPEPLQTMAQRSRAQAYRLGRPSLKSGSTTYSPCGLGHGTPCQSLSFPICRMGITPALREHQRQSVETTRVHSAGQMIEGQCPSLCHHLRHVGIWSFTTMALGPLPGFSGSHRSYCDIDNRFTRSLCRAEAVLFALLLPSLCHLCSFKNMIDTS